jgi:DNA repair exonuclease SbcCD ATPase subunit
MKVEILRTTETEILLKVSPDGPARFHHARVTRAREEAKRLIDGNDSVAELRRAIREEQDAAAELASLQRNLDELRGQREAALRGRNIDELKRIDNGRAETETRIKYLGEIRQDLSRLQTTAIDTAAHILGSKLSEACAELDARRVAILNELAELPALAELLTVLYVPSLENQHVRSEAAMMVESSGKS